VSEISRIRSFTSLKSASFNARRSSGAFSTGQF
jgi:hypothetical protein